MPLNNELKAIDLLADWSKWVIIVETATLSAIGAFWKPDVVSEINYFAKVLMAFGVLFFTCSIFSAAILLKSLPATVQRLPMKDEKDIFHMGTYEGDRGLPLYRLANIETYGFICGLVCFSLAIVISIFTS
jgi:hypothetical protein